MSRNRSRRRRDMSRSGFTLMEVLLVLAILVILGALAFFSFGDVLFSAKTKAAKTQIDATKLPLANYMMEEGSYPDSLQALSTPGPRTGRTFMAQVPPDPWGNPYGYEKPTGTDPSAQPRVWSNGPDGQQGTGDDISNMTVNQ